MFKLSMTSVVVTLVVILVTTVSGHGRLWEPPSRGTMWRRGFSTPVDYQDMELFCGGVAVQYGQNGGKCGVCGDPWNGPRTHEAGGLYATGTISRYYKIGQTIDVIVDLTANHMGYFEFRLCPSDDPSAKITDECLVKHPLKVEDAGGKTRYYIPSGDISGHIQLKVRLPDGIKCKACFFQWRYTAGNSWGTNPDGRGCIGCGNQEQFYGCADIAIGYNTERVMNETTTHTGGAGSLMDVKGTHRALRTLLLLVATCAFSSMSLILRGCFLFVNAFYLSGICLLYSGHML